MKKKMKRQFTAVYAKSGRWYVGWVEEVPGANAQEKTEKEVRASLQEALGLILGAKIATLEY